MQDENVTSKNFEFGYSPSLDGLRGIAIIAVMAFNGHVAGMRGAFLGVDMFFALSGFLITCVLLQGYSQTSGIGLKTFYLRRAFRLLPALFGLIVFCIAYALLFQQGENASATLNGVLYTLFYVANWAQAPPFEPGIGPLSHAWSLSVEEQFYIVWPLLLLVLLKLNRKAITVAVLLILITASILTSVLMWDQGVPHLRMYFGSDTRAHQLLIGCLAALLLSWGSLRATQNLGKFLHAASAFSVVGILLSFSFARHTGAFVYNGGFALVSLGTTILILDLLLFPSGMSRVLELRPLVWIGKISYGLYLWHYPIFEASRQVFEGRLHPILYSAIGVAGTVMVATASYYLVEQPLLSFGRRFGTKNRSSHRLTVTGQPAESV